jgi:tRNA-specific 2-thiouridylase
VVSYALDELRLGRTPSPDVFCNRRIKFGVFWDVVAGEFDSIATGHYAVVDRVGDTARLKRSPDPVKDQTYFLSHLSQSQLRRALFPIGHLEKSQVRRAAARFGLPNKNRKDSQGICFLGKLRYPDFVRHYLGVKPGPIIEKETGNTLGEHDGFWFYTIGQRSGLGLAGGPWYVTQKDTKTNTVFVSHQDRQGLTGVFHVRDPNWIGDAPQKKKLAVKIRHGPKLACCTIDFEPDGRMRVEIEPPDAGVASGQFAVFYDGDVCLGGATIC